MVQVSITVDGGKDIIRVLGKFPRKLRDSSIRELRNMGEFVKNEMMGNVPVASGELMSSVGIDYRNISNGSIEVYPNEHLPQAAPQEFGFTAHYVPMGFIHQSVTRGFIGGSDVPSLYGLPYRAGQARVGHHTPYVRPAYAAAQRRFPMMIKHISNSLKL